MASIGISEFTFGYAFLYEQTHANWDNLQASPVLPNLQQEQHEGWDAHLPLTATDFYYQFKLSDYLSRGNAKYIADGTYPGPYYRLAFHRKDNNRQHQRLRHHSIANPNTYYVAPEFNDAEDFNSAFLARQLTEQSRMIPITDCDDVDDGKQHYITFQEHQSGWVQHSERKYHERSLFGRDLEELYRGSERQWKSVNEAYATDLFEKSAQVVRAVLEKEDRRAFDAALPLLDFNPGQADRGDILIRTSQILSVFLGVTMVLVGAKA
jgi:hypothetical protein